jgi:hypothetical protein
MKTEDLIAALSADTVAPPRLERTVAAALASGAVGALLLLMATLHPRPDLAEAMHTVRFVAKFAVTVPLACVAVWLLRAQTRPVSTPARRISLLGVPLAILAAAVVLELLFVPESNWWVRMIGSNSRWCLAFVPIFSIPPLAAFLIALRQGAPARPTMAGLIAGFAAAGIGASVYAMHCPDDSPLFVALWYTLGIAVVAAAGAALGRVLLRW